eukprot:TRINITY_DN32651_c0_g1_i3.p1 TRINITY_DN32651_c0_g1~~TRINITY_DN32651_c0_g1_i3.p1  ORF type:complete len:2361 (+),score=547.08 TRINITY_DN32651_c0_g1_i3:59-7141(+)
MNKGAIALHEAAVMGLGRQAQPLALAAIAASEGHLPSNGGGLCAWASCTQGGAVHDSESHDVKVRSQHAFSGGVDLEQGLFAQELPQAMDCAARATFRACIYSGENLPCDNTYVVVEISKGEEGAARYESPVVSNSSFPVWEFCIEDSVALGNKEIPIDVKLYGRRVLGSDRLLGAAMFYLPKAPVDEPQRQQLVLHTGDAHPLSCAQQLPPAKLQLVWQLCDCDGPTSQLDLLRVAEMEPGAAEKKQLQVDVRISHLQLLRPTGCAQKVAVKLQLEPGGRRTPGSAAQAKAVLPRTSPSTSMRRPWRPTSVLLAAAVPVSADPSQAETEDSASTTTVGSGSRSQSTSQLSHQQSSAARSGQAEDGVRFGAPALETVPSGLPLGCDASPADATGAGASSGEDEAAFASDDALEGALDKEPVVADHVKRYMRRRRGDDKKKGKTLRHRCRDAYWAEAPFGDGWRMEKWQLQESRVGLLGYVLRATVYWADGDDEADWRPLGEWSERLGNAMEVIRELGKALHFRAQIIQKDGYCMGFLEMELDIFGRHPHRRRKTATMKVGQSGLPAEPVPVWPSLPAEAVAKQQVTHFCTVYADGLIMSNGEEIVPHVKIELGDSRADTGPPTTGFQWHVLEDGEEEEEKHQAGRTVWEEPLRLQATASDRTARVQVWASSRGIFSKRSSLLGEAMIYDVAPHQTYWLHLYGGAHTPTRPERAAQMVRGAIARPSTYHGAVAVFFGTRPRPLPRLLQKLSHQRRPKVLIVRLYRALYLDSFAGQRVTVKLHLGGGYVLDFAGFVDETGVLRFDAPTSKPGLLTNLLANQQPDSCRWVEKATSLETPLMVLPNVTHVYLYISPEGDEQSSKVPKVFGRLQLVGQSFPQWRRLRYDQSLTELPEAIYENDTAGYMLGAAALVDADESVQFTPTLRGFPGVFSQSSSDALTVKSREVDSNVASTSTFTSAFFSTQRQPTSDTNVRYALRFAATQHKVYFHVDVLAGRDLLAGARGWQHRDGLDHPYFKLRVEDKCVEHHEDISKSLNPTFLQRLVVPVELDVPKQAGDDEGLPPPPIVFQLFDRSQEWTHKLLGGLVRFPELIGTIVVKRPRLLEKVIDGRLDVNSAHDAVWHALDEHSELPFGAEATDNSRSWSGRPRVLLAAGFSALSNVAGPEQTGKVVHDNGTTSLRITTHELARFNMSVDLLGLRNLPQDVTKGSGAELVMSSYWEEGPLVVQVPRGINPNFDTTEDEEDWRRLKEEFGSRVNIVSHSKILDTASPVSSVGGASVATHDTLALTCELSDFLGLRVVAPTYSVPVLPYLQVGSARHVQLLMPELVFQLRDGVSDKDFGMLSVPLPMDELQIDGKNEDWAKKTAREYDALPKELKNLQVTTDATIDDDSYSVFIDIFAATEGYLHWDPDVCVGKGLSQQPLFVISDTEGAQGKPTHIMQSFNPADWMCGEDSEEPFDERVTPSLRCGVWNSSTKQWDSTRGEAKCRAPLGPAQLFEDILQRPQLPGTDGLRQPKGVAATPAQQAGIAGLHDLKTISTQQLRNKMKSVGWRAVSHFAAPERLCKKRFGKHRCGWQPGLAQNLHTFVRPVGHIIDREKDRDSVFLARLRLALPEYILRQLHEVDGREQQGSEPRKARLFDFVRDQSNCRNFLTIKFNFSGVIVWAPPEQVSQWSEPGSTLFVVLRNNGDKVTVTVPSFDLRYPYETGWFIKKTLTTRWSTLRGRIRARSTKDCHVCDQDDEDDATATTAAMEAEADGYSQPIWVSENAFVCRLAKSLTSHNFDRPRTKNWYQSVLSELFPELAMGGPCVEMVPGVNPTKELFFSRFLNLRRSLAANSTEKDHQYMLKGQVTIERLPEGAICETYLTPQVGLRPIDNLWMRTEVNVNVYVLTARHLNLEVLEEKMLRPYIVAEIIGGPKAISPVVDDLSAGLTRADFYHHFNLSSVLPGAAILRLELRHGHGNEDKLLGAVEVDLEDRWLALTRRELRASSSESFLARHVSPAKTSMVRSPLAAGGGLSVTMQPEDVTRPQWIEPVTSEYQQEEGADDADVQVIPRIAPLQNMPIEKADIRKEEVTGSKSVGALRFWVDISPATDAYEWAKIAPAKQNFEIRITIWCVKGITIFKDSGERNDLYVRGKYLSKGRCGTDFTRTVKTDVHRWAHTEAYYNYRWVFDAAAPTQSCAVELSLLDADSLVTDDLVYAPKMLCLDHMLRLAFRDWREGKGPLGAVTEQVVFDARAPQSLKKLQKEAEQKRRRCCCCMRKRPPKINSQVPPATLLVDVEILPKDVAEKCSVLEGQVTAPRARMSWGMLLTDPCKFLHVILGPRKTRLLTIFSICVGVVLLLILLLLLVDLLMNTVLHPFT